MIRSLAQTTALLVALLLGGCVDPGPQDPPKVEHIVHAPAASWRVTVIDADAGALVDAKVAADAAGRLHVAYSAGRDDLRYAVGDADGFSITTIDEDTNEDAWAPAIALGGARAPGGPSVAPAAWSEEGNDPEVFIAWSRRDLGELRLARLTNGVPETQTVARSSGSGFASTSLEVDAEGRAHLAWLAGVMDMMYPPSVMHTYENEAGQYVAEEASDVALDNGAALAFDASGAPHIVSYNRALYHSARGDDGWATEFVGAEGTGLDPSLATDRDGGAHVLCGGQGAHYARYADGEWSVEQLEAGENDGLRSTIVTDGDGLAHGLWVSDGKLEYVRRSAAGDFIIEPIDVALDVDADPGLIVNVDGTPSAVASVVQPGGSTALVLLERER